MIRAIHGANPFGAHSLRSRVQICSRQICRTPSTFGRQRLCIALNRGDCSLDGIVRNHPWFRPFGRTRPTKIVPDDFVEPDRLRDGVRSLDPGQNKRPPEGGLVFWLGERDRSRTSCARPLRGAFTSLRRPNLFPTNLSNPVGLCPTAALHRALAQTKNKKATARVAFLFLAGGEGFEPPLAESESAVLPLDDPPVVNQIV